MTVLMIAACSTDRPPRGMCNVEQVDVTWLATIERGGTTSSERLGASLTPTSVEPPTFDSLVATLVHGRAMESSVMWSVPAFDTDPGGIAVVHPSRLRRGDVLRLGGVPDSAGWGLMPPLARDSALAGVEAGEFLGGDVSGTIQVLETGPLALRLDVTAKDSSGASVRVRGDAQFSLRRQRQRCEALAERRRD